MDNLRYEILYVYNHCPQIVLEREQLKQLLSGNYKKVVEEHKAEDLKFKKIEEERQLIEVDETPKIVSITLNEQPDVNPIQISGRSKPKRKRKTKTKKE